jgi:Domain of unknown function (DUF4421)
MKCFSLLLITTVISVLTVSAQDPTGYDSSYYQSYKGSIIVRAFLSRKYSEFKLNPPTSLSNMTYHANTPLSLGAGFTYGAVSFNFSKGLSFSSPQEQKGQTNSTDLQLHLYKRKWTVDVLAEFYKGYYLRPEGLGTADGQGFYLRPDLGTQLVGGSAYRILNDKKFSYSGGLTQNAWQKRSAGSFLIGGEAFYIAANGDSSFVPSKVDSQLYQSNIRKLHLFEFGPGVGYAYTLVVAEHFFLIGSANVNFNLHFTRELGNGIASDKIGFTPNFIFRLGTGYNTSRWGLSVGWLWASINAIGQFTGYHYNSTNGNYRLVYFRRIALNRRMKRILRPTSE